MMSKKLEDMIAEIRAQDAAEKAAERARPKDRIVDKGAYVTVRRFGDYIRLIACLREGRLSEKPVLYVSSDDLFESDDGSGLGRLAANVSRARTRIRELALCNDWDYFVTLTLSPEWGDRTDLPRWRADLSRWLRSLRRRRGYDVKYLFVPEEHEAGGWHMHGLIRGVPVEELRLFTLREKLPKYIRDKLQEGAAVYDWPAYRKRYGFVDLERVRSRGAVCSYISKYTTKALDDLILAANAHSFYASQGLAGAEEVVSGWLLDQWHFPFSNDYTAIHDLPAEGWMDTLIGMIDEDELAVDDLVHNHVEQVDRDVEIIRYYASIGMHYEEAEQLPRRGIWYMSDDVNER